MKTIKELREHYPAIVEWGKMLASCIGFVNDQLRLAEIDNAPRNAIFKSGGIWHTTDGITRPETKARFSRFDNLK